jgi:hypothetical protein
MAIVRSPLQKARMMRIPSSSAFSASPPERTGPPIAAIASQKAPAPRPSSKRPPESTSREAACFAIIAGPLSGRFATSGKIRIRSLRPMRSAISDHVSR